MMGVGQSSTTGTDLGHGVHSGKAQVVIPTAASLTCGSTSVTHSDQGPGWALEPGLPPHRQGAVTCVGRVSQPHATRGREGTCARNMCREAGRQANHPQGKASAHCGGCPCSAEAELMAEAEGSSQPLPNGESGKMKVARSSPPPPPRQGMRHNPICPEELLCPLSLSLSNK